MRSNFQYQRLLVCFARSSLHVRLGTPLLPPSAMRQPAGMKEGLGRFPSRERRAFLPPRSAVHPPAGTGAEPPGETGSTHAQKHTRAGDGLGGAERGEGEGGEGEGRSTRLRLSSPGGLRMRERYTDNSMGGFPVSGPQGTAYDLSWRCKRTTLLQQISIDRPHY